MALASQYLSTKPTADRNGQVIMCLESMSSKLLQSIHCGLDSMPSQQRWLARQSWPVAMPNLAMASLLGHSGSVDFRASFQCLSLICSSRLLLKNSLTLRWMFVAALVIGEYLFLSLPIDLPSHSQQCRNGKVSTSAGFECHHSWG